MSNLSFSVIQKLKHFGICDASASVSLGEDRFIVGNDETDEDLGNVLRIYSSQTSGEATKIIDINGFVNTKKEIDLEAVTELDGIIYWITSHGRNKDGLVKPKRHQFFATKLTDNNSSLEQVGKSYTQLVFRDMLEDTNLEQFNIKEAETKAPKVEGGLNIEGLTATPEGNLLIGFRNPIPDGKALLLPLKNPKDLVTKEVRAKFGEPITLDLGGLGIRSIEYWSVIQAYLIIAGEFDGGERFKLYSWSGNSQEAANPIDSIQFPDLFRPESILLYPHLGDRFQILSDDGAISRVNGQPCKDIDDKNNPEKYFRSIWVKINCSNCS
jgi:hypothetical protein